MDSFFMGMNNKKKGSLLRTFLLFLLDLNQGPSD